MLWRKEKRNLLCSLPLPVELLPRRLSTVQILPTKTIDSFPSPGNL